MKMKDFVDGMLMLLYIFLFKTNSTYVHTRFYSQVNRCPMRQNELLNNVILTFSFFLFLSAVCLYSVCFKSMKYGSRIR